MVVRILKKINNIIKVAYLKMKFKNSFELSGNISFRKGFSIEMGKNGRIKLGKNCFFNNYCSLNCLENIEIGDNTIFGENVKIYDHNHVFNTKGKIIQAGYKSKKVKIGNNCWIGTNTIILKGAEIGDNVVIGAGCIIDQRIPENTLVTPNRTVKIKEIIRYE